MRTRSRLTSGVAALSAAAALSLVPSPAAHAAGSCTLNAPARVSIGQPYTEIPLSLAANCIAAGVDLAAWDLIHPTQGPKDFTYFDGTTTETWAVYDYDTLGPMRWTPSGAWDGEFNEVAQSTNWVDTRVASWASLAGGRSGSTVSFTISLARYSGGYHKYIPWSAKVGSVQYRPKGTSTWNHLTFVKTNSAGKAYITRTLASTHEFRVQFPSETYIWGVWTLPKAL